MERATIQVIGMRLEAAVKMGYYPTPPGVSERIGSFMQFPEHRVNLLDPCCGEGLALRGLASGTDAVAYGIELDAHRAEQARTHLDHVLKCGYEDARISNNAFSCLLLNPPYDWAEQHGDAPRHRTESTFLKATTRYVQSSGLLVYIVPQHRVTGDIPKLLSHRFTDFSAYRFPEEDYEPFRQVVVFGAKKQKPSVDTAAFAKLSAIPNETLAELPYADAPVYTLPPSPPVTLFRSTALDQEDLERELRSSPLWERIDGHATSQNGRLDRPPLPLHAGHLGLLLASGHLDGIVGEGDERHVVRGKADKVTHTYSEHDGDSIIERQVERYQVSIKLLTQDGEIATLM